MPLNLDLNLPNVEPKPQYQTLDNWKKGVISLLDRSRLPKDALETADNIFLVEDGQPTPRPGVDWYGTDVGAAIDGVDYFDNGTTVHLVVAAGGTIYRSTDNGTTWDTCTSASYTAGNRCYFNQNNEYLYITNGVDNMIRYDGTTTLQTYSSLSAPTFSSSDVAQTGMAGSSYTYKYKIAAVNEVGFSIASSEGTETTNTARADWEAGTKYITLTLPSYVAGQTRFDVYLSEDNGSNYYYIGSAANPNTTWVDDGTAIPVPSTTAPTDDTTTGPLVEELVNVGSRMYGVRDSDNPARIWFSSGTLPGAFSNAYDGGYLDWQTGGKNVPVKVADYRDGKGTPYATVWCKSADGQGAVLQMSLDIFTIGDISITVPAAYQLPGSRGTPAPGSVINVLNDFMFYNSQAFYNLGSRPNLQQILSTDEVSANIRPDVKRISTSAADQICSIYFDAKVFFSVPYGTSTNSHTAVYDTERRAWLPKGFTIGFDKFLRYTDTDGNPRLLAYKNGDTQLSEISDSIQGDYGVAFNTTLVTGLYPTTKNRFEFQYTEEAEVEFSNPQGTINVNLQGIERSAGYSSAGETSIQTSTTNAGWGVADWGSFPWSDSSIVPETYSEASVKRYFRVQEELNAVQWRITTASLDARYVLRTLQTWGTQTFAGKPRDWRISTN